MMKILFLRGCAPSLSILGLVGLRKALRTVLEYFTCERKDRVEGGREMIEREIGLREREIGRERERERERDRERQRERERERERE